MTAIEFENISKQYLLGQIGTGTLSKDLNRWWASIRGKEDPYLKIGQINDRTKHADSNFVWALKDINLTVEQGDVVGIIGKNGSGKSTLLKILSKVTSPTTGRIRGRGRVASLLEVGTGFHPEMTGRENIYMNGAIMGMNRQEITRKLDEIVDFAGVQMYVDTPVKRYSSGMSVRLGFAIAAHLEPEILVVDEVLAVGDAEFQKKAVGKMQDVSRGEGRTVLFVSHNMATVRNLCQKGVVLSNGQKVFEGTSADAVDFYLTNNNNAEDSKIIDSVVIRQSYITVSEVSLNGTTSSHSTITSDQEYIDLNIVGHTDVPMKCDVKLILRNTSGVPVGLYMEGRYKDRIDTFSAGDFQISRKIALPHYLAKGDLVVDLILYQPQTRDYFVAEHCAVLSSMGKFDAYGRPIILNREGLIGLESYED